MPSTVQHFRGAGEPGTLITRSSIERGMASAPAAWHTSSMPAHEETTELDASDTARPKPRVSYGEIRDRGLAFIADIVKWIALLFAIVLIIYIVLYAAGANPGNGIYRFIHSWADTVSFGFKNLFTLSKAKLDVLANYGCATVFWILVSGIVPMVIRRFGSRRIRA
jgi:hypothetical protein